MIKCPHGWPVNEPCGACVVVRNEREFERKIEKRTAKLEAEVVKLRHDLQWSNQTNCDAIGRWKTKAETLQAALREYGEHKGVWCTTDACTCGLDKVLQEIG